MPAEVIESILRITHDPDAVAPNVLLNFGDDVLSESRLQSGQLVDIVNAVRKTGVVTFARDNERNQFTIPKATENATIRGAHDAMFSAAVAVPRYTSDVLFEVEDGGTWRMKNATIQAWDGGVESIFSIQMLSIIGGELSEVIPAPADVVPTLSPVTPGTIDLTEGGGI